VYIVGWLEVQLERKKN